MDVFGSVARGEAGPASDVNVVVRFAAGSLPRGLAGFAFLDDLEAELSGELDYPVNLVTADFLQTATRLGIDACVEVSGEASTRMGPQFHGDHPSIPWRLISGMRDRLIHGYQQVEMTLLWETAMQDLPMLPLAVEAILQAAGLERD